MNPTSNNDSANVLNADVELQGTLRFSGELTFDGKLDGDISSEGNLTLGDNAVVRGNINVNSVVVRGRINGNITAREKIDVKARTELFGDIRAARLVIEEGVTFVGQSEVNPNKATQPPRIAEAPKAAPVARAPGR